MTRHAKGAGERGTPATHHRTDEHASPPRVLKPRRVEEESTGDRQEPGGALSEIVLDSLLERACGCTGFTPAPERLSHSDINMTLKEKLAAVNR